MFAVWRTDAAVKLVEAALDDTAEQFRRSGTIWEFYHPHGGRPEELKRKPQTGRNQPFGDYIGHNPLLAMARLWEKNLGVAGKAPVWMWGVLILLLLLGGWVRFHNIERNGLWVDEMWAVFIACGRGVSAFHIPMNQVLDPAPQLGLAGAPAWWTIWTNVGTSIHPPLYHLTLRGWMNVFGQGDLATRSMSVMFGLLGFVLLFDVVRKMSGNAAGICAAAVMTMAVSQIDFAQEARPYTMMVVLGLIACRAVVLIERSGARVGLLIQLMLAALASFLTHYFTVFSFAGLGIYVLWRLRGRERVKAAGAIVMVVSLRRRPGGLGFGGSIRAGIWEGCWGRSCMIRSLLGGGRWGGWRNWLRIICMGRAGGDGGGDWRDCVCDSAIGDSKAAGGDVVVVVGVDVDGGDYDCGFGSSHADRQQYEVYVFGDACDLCAGEFAAAVAGMEGMGFARDGAGECGNRVRGAGAVWGGVSELAADFAAGFSGAGEVGG